MRELLKERIEDGSMKAEMLVKKHGGLDAMTDEEVASVCRILGIKKKSDEQTAYEVFMAALQRHDDAQHSIAIGAESRLGNLEVISPEAVESYKAIMAEAMETMKANYELANNWYRFTNHGKTLYPITK